MFKLFAALAATALVASTGFAADDAKASTSDFQKNLKIAMSVEPAGQLMRSRVESKPNGTTVMGFYLYDRNNRLLFEREVEMKSGAIVKDTSKTMSAVAKDMANLISKQTDAKAKLPDGRLLEIAGEHLKDKSFNEMKYEKVNDTLVFTVGDTSFDAATGKVVERKTAEKK
jgi:hypothetical protein